MKSSRFTTVVGATVWVLSCALLRGQPQPLRIGITAGAGPGATVERWQPLAGYLSGQLPEYQFSIVPLRAEQLYAAVQQRRIDFALVAPPRSVLLELRTGATPLATLRSLYAPGSATNLMGGSVLFRAGDGRITRWGDLRGKRVAAIEPMSLGGWISVWRELHDEGLDPQRDLAGVEFLGTREAIVEALRKGAVDVGVAPAGTMESFAETGYVRASEFRVLPPRENYAESVGYPLAHSTRLYPETPFTALSHIPEPLARRVAIALLRMPPEGEVARNTRTAGWTLPGSYQPVHQAMQVLRIEPYQDFGKVTVATFVQDHLTAVLAALLSIVAVLAVSTAVVLALNRRLAQSQAALRSEFENRLESEARFRSVFEDSAIGVCLAAPDGRIQQTNAAFRRMFGYAEEELREMTAGGLTEPEERASEAALYQRLLDEGNDFYELDKRCLKKNGETMWVHYVESVVRSAQGTVTARIGMVEDITARKQAEEVRAKLESQLRQAQKLESVGRLAGGVAHDFNNLLTVIQGYANLLLARLPATDEHRGLVEQIGKAGEKAADLTQQLLAFSRKQMIQPQVLDLNAVIMEAGKLIQRLIGEDVHLVTHLDPSLGLVLADAGQMQQVLMNLATNARDAMPRGGRFTIETTNVELGPEYAATHPDVSPGAYVLLTATDTGEGMDERTKQNLFEPFFTTKEKGKGTGLGLSTLYGIVRQSGGWVWVYSERGQGSAFKIYLPRVEGRRRQEEQPAAVARTEPGGTETILVAEDQEDVRTFVATVLRGYGYRVLEAQDGASALARSESCGEPIHLLITDVVMPGMTGRQLAERLRETRPGMKVLYMSGYTENVIAKRGVLEPGIAYLAKPFAPAVLAAKAREVLDAPARP